MEMKNDLNGLKEEAKIYEREILSMLLEVSKSFTTDEMTKEKREENFSKIDELREKLKSVSKVIEDIEHIVEIGDFCMDETVLIPINEIEAVEQEKINAVFEEV